MPCKTATARSSKAATTEAEGSGGDLPGGPPGGGELPGFSHHSGFHGQYASHGTKPSRMAAAAGRLPVCVAQVDGNGRLRLQATDRVFAMGQACRS